MPSQRPRIWLAAGASAVAALALSPSLLFAAPSISGPTTFYRHMGTTISSIGGSPLMVQYADPTPLASITITSLPGHGALTLNGAPVTVGQVINRLNVTGFNPVNSQVQPMMEFVPDPWWVGTATIVYTASNGTESSAPAIINLESRDIAPVLSTGASYTVTGRQPFQGLGGSALGTRYTDADSDPLQSVTITSLPAHGTLTLSGVPVVPGQVIPRNVILGIGGVTQAQMLTYTPSGAFSGTDTVGVTASDGGLSSNAVTMDVITSITSNAVPTITGVAAFAADQDTVFRGVGGSAVGALYADPDGDHLSSATITTLPAHGTLTLNGAPVVPGQVIPRNVLLGINGVPVSGMLAYQPAPGWSGTDVIGYTVSDGAATSLPAAMEMRVAAAAVPGEASPAPEAPSAIVCAVATSRVRVGAALTPATILRRNCLTPAVGVRPRAKVAVRSAAVCRVARTGRVVMTAPGTCRVRVAGRDMVVRVK